MKNDAYYRNGETLTFAPTTHEEERELFRRAKSGDGAATETIIRNHLLLVATIARRLAKGKLPEDEIISAANFALMKAFQNFDPSFPNRFSSFLKLHVRGEIVRLWRGKNIVDKKDTFDDGEPVVSVPLVEDTAEDTTAEDNDHQSFLLKLLSQSKGVLDEREAEIVGLIFNELPLSQADVARKLTLSRERVRQIFDGAMEKLRREMRRQMNENKVNQ